jgi:hypothetical protein
VTAAAAVQPSSAGQSTEAVAAHDVAAPALAVHSDVRAAAQVPSAVTAATAIAFAAR